MNTNRKAIYTIVLIAIVSMLLSACNAPQGVSSTYFNMDQTARASHLYQLWRSGTERHPP
jgi:hypothetical protein